MSINGFEPTPWVNSNLDPHGPDWNRQELPSDEGVPMSGPHTETPTGLHSVPCSPPVGRQRCNDCTVVMLTATGRRVRCACSCHQEQPDGPDRPSVTRQ